MDAIAEATIDEANKRAVDKPVDNSKINLLLYGDYCCATGFAQVLGNIARELHKSGKYNIDVVGINYSGDPYDEEKWPGRVFPAMPGSMANAGPYGDVYGRQRLLDLMGSGKYDVVYMIQDTFVIEPMMDEVLKTQQALIENGSKTFKTVFYFPVDAQLKPDWVEAVDKSDFPVVYTKYGYAEVLKHKPELQDRLNIIYHGNNPDDFFPIEDKDDVKEFRKQYFNGRADDRFLIVNINRNQPRKDVARNLMILKELWDRGRRPLMYLHMQYEDAGGNIFTMANQLGLGKEYEFFMPSPKIFSANQGMPIEDVNRIYNAADLVLSTTLGEGWGLSATEAMATKTPLAIPGNTSFNEIGEDDRAALLNSGTDASLWIVKEQDNDRLRPLTDVMAAADRIEAIMDGKQIPDTEAAYKWVRELDWSNICKKWMEVIDQAAQAANEQNTAVEVQRESQFMNRAQRRKLKREGKI